MDERTTIKFDALRNAIYHGARRNFLDTVNRFMSFLVILGGAGAVSEALGWPTFWALLATVGGTFQLVFDFGGRAKEHAFLQRRFYDVVASVEACLEPDGAQIAGWRSDLARIYADEPPTLRALDAVAYNDAADAMGTGWHLEITPRQSFLRHIVPYYGASFAVRYSPPPGANEGD